MFPGAQHYGSDSLVPSASGQPPDLKGSVMMNVPGNKNMLDRSMLGTYILRLTDNCM